MAKTLVYCAGISRACLYAAEYLKADGVRFSDALTTDITHLLLDVPSFQDNGLLRNGDSPSDLFRNISEDCAIIGGNLSSERVGNHPSYDLLRSEDYLCKNAAITAHCALTVALPHLSRTIAESTILVIGWGRIGKCLSHLLKNMGADVCLILRNPKEIALAEALGYQVISGSLQLPHHINIIFNTAPQPVITRAHYEKIPNCAKIDLASLPGLEGDDVIIARGLPGKYAPISSGKLIAQTILPILKEE